MRLMIFGAVLVLLQLLSLGMAWSLQWFLRPIVDLRFWPLAIACLVLSNALLMAAFVQWFRVPTNWLAILWLGLLSAVISVILIWLTKTFGLNMGISAGLQHRLIALTSFVGLVALALYNAYTPTVRYLTIQVDKALPTPVRLAVVSDLHLGFFVGRRQLGKLGALLDDHNVDLMLMPGDIMDDDTLHFNSEAMAESFARAINTPRFGTVASLGNHDLYRTSAYDAITMAVVDANALLLNDQVKTLSLSKDGHMIHLNLIGRYDDHFSERLPTWALVEQVDARYPTILLDHRPSQIDQNTALDIDLQVSGHTHNGQVFPANLIVKLLNRVSYGHERINGTHVVVSSGYGFWGVPFRLGSQAEVWVIDMIGREPKP